MLQTLCNVLIIILFLLWHLYWLVMERKAIKLKPKTKPITWRAWIRKQVMGLFFVCVIAQMLGYNIAPFPQSTIVLLGGTGMVIIGIGISVVARRILAANWVDASEYQIKKNQELVINGIYAYIRHPIYTGLMLALIGVELVVHSYVVFGFAVVLFIVFYMQGKREERLLEKHFGEQYRVYMNRSSMFIPHII